MVIGFVSHILAVGCWRLAVGRAGIGFVSHFLAVGLGELGSFRIFGARHAVPVQGDWVRFAYLGLGKPARRQRYGNWVRFAFFGLPQSPQRTQRTLYIDVCAGWFSIFRLLVGLLYRPLCCNALYHSYAEKASF